MKKTAKTLLTLLLTMLLSIQAFAFSDVSSSYWAKNDIDWAVEQKIFEGYGDNTFLPENAITRAEALKVITKHFNYKSENSVTFADVSKDEWYYSSINDGNDLIVNLPTSNNETSFLPNTNITREEAVFAIVNAGYKDKLSGYVGDINYSDINDISDYAKMSIAFATKNGIINGYEDNTFLPKNEITRAEFAKIMHNLPIIKEDTTTPDDNTNVTIPDNSTEDTNSSNSTLVKYSTFIPVLNVTSAVNDEGTEVTQIKGLTNGKETITLSSKNTINTIINIGDTVMPNIYPSGLIRDFFVLAKVNGNSLQFNFADIAEASSSNRNIHYYYGQVTNIERGKNVTITPVSGSYGSSFTVKQDANIYVYDAYANSKSRITASDLSVVEFDNGTIYGSQNTVYSSAYIIAKEYDGIITDTTLYLLK